MLNVRSFKMPCLHSFDTTGFDLITVAVLQRFPSSTSCLWDLLELDMIHKGLLDGWCLEALAAPVEISSMCVADIGSTTSLLHTEVSCPPHTQALFTNSGKFWDHCHDLNWWHFSQSWQFLYVPVMSIIVYMCPSKRQKSASNGDITFFIFLLSRLAERQLVLWPALLKLTIGLEWPTYVKTNWCTDNFRLTSGRITITLARLTPFASSKSPWISGRGHHSSNTSHSRLCHPSEGQQACLIVKPGHRTNVGTKTPGTAQPQLMPWFRSFHGNYRSARCPRCGSLASPFWSKRAYLWAWTAKSIQKRACCHSPGPDHNIPQPLHNESLASPSPFHPMLKCSRKAALRPLVMLRNVQLMWCLWMLRVNMRSGVLTISKSPCFLTFSMVLPYTLLFINLNKSFSKSLLAFFLFSVLNSMCLLETYCPTDFSKTWSML